MDENTFMKVLESKSEVILLQGGALKQNIEKCTKNNFTLPNSFLI